MEKEITMEKLNSLLTEYSCACHENDSRGFKIRAEIEESVLQYMLNHSVRNPQ